QLASHACCALRALPSFPTRRSSDLQGNEHVGGAVGADDDLDAVARVMRTASPDESYSRYSRRLRGSIRSGAASLSPTSPTIPNIDRKSTRLNSSHDQISYAVFFLKK